MVRWGGNGLGGSDKYVLYNWANIHNVVSQNGFKWQKQLRTSKGALANENMDTF